MASIFNLPEPLRTFLSKFPLHTYPPIKATPRRPLQGHTLWIAPPRTSADDQSTNSDTLSTDVKCLKWQAYIALRGLTDIAVRWDISPEGAVDGSLPCLHVLAEVQGDDSGEVLASGFIPRWVDVRTGSWNDPLNGFRDQNAKDESNAWVSLLDGVVHTALVCAFYFVCISCPHPDCYRQTLSQPPKSVLFQLFKTAVAGRALEATFPLPAPLTGLSSLLPPYGANITLSSIQGQYAEAIASLSERLGSDRWFLGSV
jgi:metaxin